MAGYSNPSLLEMAQGYQFGGRVRGRRGRGRPPTPPGPPPPIAPPIAPSGVGGGGGGYSMGPPQAMTAGAYAGAPPSPISGGTSTMGQATAPAGGVMTQTSAPAGGGGATPPGGGYDPGAYGTTAGIAEEFGFDPEKYSEYFTAISPEMQAATQEGTYDPYFQEQIGQLREQKGGQVAGLRQNLLQSVMQSQQASAGSGFAGGAAGGQQLLDLTRAGAESQYGDIGAAYGRGKYGVKETISGRMSAGRQAIEAAKRANIGTAGMLLQAGAGMGGGGGGTDMTASQEQWSQSGQYGASATGSTQGYIDENTGLWTEPDTGVIETTQVGGDATSSPSGAQMQGTPEDAAQAQSEAVASCESMGGTWDPVTQQCTF